MSGLTALREQRDEALIGPRLGRLTVIPAFLNTPPG